MIDNFELGLSSIPLVTPVLLDRSGQPITGSTTIVAEIRRIGTSDRWDFNDNTFKTSGWTTRQGPLAEVSASLDAGIYERAAGWVATAVVAGVYLVTYRDTTGLALPATEAFRLGGPADAVITKLDVTTGSRAAAGAEMALVNDAITAAKIATNAIDGDALAADAITKIQNGLATPTNITAGVITTVTNLTNAPTNGDLTATMKSSVTAAVPTAVAISDVVRAGIIVDHGDGSYLAVSLAGLALESTLTAMKGATFDSATDSLEALRNRGDAAWITANVSGLATSTNVTDARDHIEAFGQINWVTATGFAVTGAAMTLADGALLPAKIGAGFVAAMQLNLALEATLTAMKGATFNTLTDSLEAIRDRGDAAWTGSTAGDVATAVWATAEGGAVGTVRYAITLLRKRQTGRRKMGLDGYELIYDDDNVTVIKKTLVKDILGDIVVPAAGDPSEVSQEMDP